MTVEGILSPEDIWKYLKSSWVIITRGSWHLVGRDLGAAGHSTVSATVPQTKNYLDASAVVSGEESWVQSQGPPNPHQPANPESQARPAPHPSPGTSHPSTALC